MDLLGTEVTRQCLQTLLQKTHPNLSKLLNKVVTSHQMNSLWLICQDESLAKKLAQLARLATPQLAKVLNVPLVIIHKNRFLYLIPINKSLQLDAIHPKVKDNHMAATSTLLEPVTIASLTESEMADDNKVVVPWNRMIETFASVTNTSPEEVSEQLRNMVLSVDTMNALGQEFFKHKTQQALEQIASEDNHFNTPAKTEASIDTPSVVAETTTLTPPAQTEEVNKKQILDAAGLPIQIGGIRKVIPLAVPERATASALKNEKKDVQRVILEGLKQINKPGTKHVSVLQNMVQQTPAGEIYLSAFTELYQPTDSKKPAVDVTDKHKRERRGKLIAAAQALLDELAPPPIEPSESDKSAQEE